MPRNTEVIRQWTILREIERARASGVTIDELATLCAVTTRTIRRDLQALEEAGFPLFDDKSRDDGRTRWSLNGQPFKTLGVGLTVSELCALYFSRTLLESLAGTPFKDELEGAFEKLASVLTPHMRQFLDRLPRVIATKPGPSGRRFDAPREQLIIARALDATLRLRQADITYHSRSSERTKTYRVHPYRLVYAQGGLYLLAYVPEYGEVRTFAVERIQELALADEHFTPLEQMPDAAFPHSLGVFSGTPEYVELELQPTIVDYIRSREWHPSQRLSELADRATLTLNVCIDQALTSWILSLGASVRVIAPASLAHTVAGQLEDARARYADHDRADHDNAQRADQPMSRVGARDSGLGNRS